jgi:hypothetical protein
MIWRGDAGFIYAITTLGIGVGYIAGGTFLKIWVDFYRDDST